MNVCVYVFMYLRTRVYACMHVCTYIAMHVPSTPNHPSVHDQIQSCHFLKQQLLLLQLALQSIMTEMYLPKPTILHATQCDSQPQT